MFVIVWQFRPKKGKEKEFERVYGPDGEWVTFFRKGAGYIETKLWKALDPEGGYLTIDRWSSGEAYNDFRRSNQTEYDAIDMRCEELTEREALIGYFEPTESS